MANKLALLLVLGGAMIALTGCYERVVGTRGIGGNRSDIQEPYQQNYGIDDWLMGDYNRPKAPMGVP
jgi:hypothetical protein